MTTLRTFIFAGGGTGGHLYPALSIADAILERAPDARCRFLCSDRPLDERILVESGHEHTALPARPFSPRPLPLVRFMRGWGPSIRLVRRIIRDAGPNVHVVAMGGFVAAPAVQAARAQRAPTTLVNLDAVPGRANRWIARHADRIVTSAPVTEGWQLVGPIVRRQAVASGTPEECRRRLGLEPDRPTLVITGGSQGARSINALIIELLSTMGDRFEGWQVLHQCGGDDARALEDAYARAGLRARVKAFVDDIGTWWGAADLCIGRAGAGTVGEVWANHVPALLLPYPYHADEHQRANARVLGEAGGAEVHTDLIDPALSAQAIGPSLADLMGDESRRDRMRNALRGLGEPDGGDRVAKLLLDEEGGPGDPG